MSFVANVLAWPARLPLRWRLTLGMLLLVIVYTLLLAFSFQITTRTRIANPPTLLIPDEEWAEFALLAQEATISDVRNAVFRNLLILVILGGLSTYWLAGRLLALLGVGFLRPWVPRRTALTPDPSPAQASAVDPVRETWFQWRACLAGEGSA